MILLFILLVLFGLFMIIRPDLVWLIKESWKSNDGTEPSDFYLFSTRLGGVVFLLAGIGGIVASFLQ